MTMVDRDRPVSEDELHAYVDGELPPDRRAVVEAWLATHPEDAARVNAWRAQAELIQSRYGGPAHEAIPPRLSIERLARLDRKWNRLAAGAVVVAFLGGAATGWFARVALEPPPAEPRSITSEALDAHRLYTVEVRHPIEVPAGADHLMRWLSKRLDYQLRAPDLAALGFKLIGGRLLPSPTGPAAFFMYETSSGERVTLYAVRSKAPETSLRYVAAGQVGAVTWNEKDIAYVISGPADHNRLFAIAQAAYDQLERRTPRGAS